MRLAILTGSHRGKKFSLKEGMILSRSGKGDILVPDPLASSPHAKIEKKRGVFYLQDLDSKNGTHKGGKIQDRFALKVGVKFRIGEVHFQVLSSLNMRKLIWSSQLACELKAFVPRIQDSPKVFVPFPTPVSLMFQSGIQKTQVWTLYYGPRVAGGGCLDLPLMDFLAPDICFSLHPDPEEGGVLFKTPHPEKVLLNSESQIKKHLSSKDRISFGGTCIEVKFLPPQK